ncbi:MAG: alpha/beta hydrolase [Phycisphaerae bacterium]
MRKAVRRRMIWWFLIAPGLIYISLCLLLYFMQDRLVYHPTSEIEQDPSIFGLAFEFVEFTSPDGLKLTGFYTPAAGESRGTILLCHGNGGNISHRIETIAIYHRMGFDSLVFDYRGYGRSAGSPSEQGTYTDARAAWDWLVANKGADPKRIVLHGRSLGGPIATHLARQVAPAGLIIESSFTSVPDLAGQMYPIFPVRLLTRYSYNTREYLGGVDCPVLVIHSHEDGMIRYSHGESLFAAAGEAKRFLEIRGDHNGGFVESGRVYTDGLEAFLDELVGL